MLCVHTLHPGARRGSASGLNSSVHCGIGLDLTPANSEVQWSGVRGCCREIVKGEELRAAARIAQLWMTSCWTCTDSANGGHGVARDAIKN